MAAIPLVNSSEPFVFCGFRASMLARIDLGGRVHDCRASPDAHDLRGWTQTPPSWVAIKSPTRNSGEPKEGAVIDMVLHWQGGDHTALQLKLKLNAAGRHHYPVPDDMITLVRELARLMPDPQIARLLNRSGKPMALGNPWTEQRVRGFRKHHDIATYRDGEWVERGEITLEAAAEIIGVCKMTALRMLRRGDIKGRQVCRGAPWVIKQDDVAAFGGNTRAQGPVTPNARQQAFDFQ